MARVSFNSTDEPFECLVSAIKSVQGNGSSCCEGLFSYEPVILDFGIQLAQRATIIQSHALSLRISTQFQTIWLLDITDMVLMEDGKLAIKCDNLIIL